MWMGLIQPVEDLSRIKGLTLPWIREFSLPDCLLTGTSAFLLPLVSNRNKHQLFLGLKTPSLQRWTIPSIILVLRLLDSDWNKTTVFPWSLPDSPYRHGNLASSITAWANSVLLCSVLSENHNAIPTSVCLLPLPLIYYVNLFQLSWSHETPWSAMLLCLFLPLYNFAEKTLLHPIFQDQLQLNHQNSILASLNSKFYSLELGSSFISANSCSIPAPVDCTCPDFAFIWLQQHNVRPLMAGWCS